MPNNHLTRFVPNRILRAAKDFDYCPLDGDIPLLQFINTFSKRGAAEPKNYLTSYREFLIWCQEVKLIDEETFDSLELEAYCYERDAASILNRVLLSRHNFYHLIDFMLRDEPVPPAVIAELNDGNDEANKHISYAMTPYGLMEGWRNTNEELAFPLWIITKSVISFLTSGDVKYIKKCHCGHLYLDTTKNRNRRYCNPLTCGGTRRSKKYFEKLESAQFENLVI